MQFKLDVATILTSFMSDENNPINMDDFSSPAKSDKSTDSLAETVTRTVSPSKSDTSTERNRFPETGTPPNSEISN